MGKKRGRLVTVEIAPGRFVKMHAEDAAKRVVVGREDKRRRADGDKGILPPLASPSGGRMGMGMGEDDLTSVPGNLPPLAPPSGGRMEMGDDLTSVPGIGNVAAATLHSLGITALAQLREVDLSGVPARIRRAIEVWRG